MQSRLQLIWIILIIISCTGESFDNTAEPIKGLQEDVEIVRDKWGINHIYAQNEHDLFFAQGYAAAKDRLFQFEIWRRQATGTVAEILGERELKRDIGTRLFKFRGNMTTEMEHYHPNGVEIITAYTDGVNAYIDEILKQPDRLPMEFKLLGIQPEKWTPEVVISRHQGLLGNIVAELQIGRAVALLGEEKVKELLWLHPMEPDLTMDDRIDQNLLFHDILDLYQAYRKVVSFRSSDVLPQYRNLKVETAFNQQKQPNLDSLSIGSNNWVISGKLMKDGNTYMANDPHRTVAVPSLRYMAHLVAPGWNVIGGGEPEIPGISIGHNEYGSWGLTVFRTDGEDLYVYDLNPENHDQYQYKGEWVDMTIVQERIPVKGQEAVEVDLKYTRHGPVTYVDSKNHKAYAVRCAWLEPGGSPYLASLRMDQAKTWEEFRDACNYSHIPGENMIWADREGNIGWQAVGIAPVRNNFSGLVPVPGDGRYEWDGYLPIVQKPHAVNPEKGYIATANQNVTPRDYVHWNAIGYSWSDPYRGNRVNQVLDSTPDMTMEDMKSLQVDVTSLPAQSLIPFLELIEFEGQAAQAKEMLLNWNHQLNSNSIEAAIYVAWENTLRHLAHERFVPSNAQNYIKSIQLKKVIDWIQTPDNKFGPQPVLGRNQYLSEAFTLAIRDLETRLGTDMSQWQYGQKKNKRTELIHALADAVNDSIAKQLILGPLPRGGNGYTPGSTSNDYRQRTGATFRLIVNTGDWDAALGTNSPGQSGDPNSPFYDNLFGPWAKDEFFPIYFSKTKIDSVAVSRITLQAY
ncbi:penicillin acylase family protein [Aureicoccus marinus]|jgi:penicillin amidase|uniref:Penicillin acylase family protein n=1 Tax=Aureicoccus marinus TaxID=754435 RepID=A0A2S7T378_9FLAO|nr:penicillin acylase family protein [Aureicoccus marinus]PQJ14353.1 penicillin acylase family protein [Aureicoccus marinus]